LNGAALDRVFREAGGRIIAALASRFRDIDLAEDALAEACMRSVKAWARDGAPPDPAAWLYRAAYRCAIDVLRRRGLESRRAPYAAEPATADGGTEDSMPIPDERLALIFLCCHPAVAIDARAALTLRLVCGLSTREIAQAFLLPEATLAQRLVRAKRKIAQAGVPFEVPGPDGWPERMDAVLSTLEVVYAKAHEDAAGRGPHAGYALEALELTRVLAQLAPEDPEVMALAATTRFTEARRSSRTDPEGSMVPLSEQDPQRWDRSLIGQAGAYLDRALALDPRRPRVVQAAIHALWCARTSLAEPPPWRQVLELYDLLLRVRDDPVVRVNRAVALAEVSGAQSALRELAALDADGLGDFLPYHAVRADLLRRAGRRSDALQAYDAAIALVATAAERAWLERRRASLRTDPCADARARGIASPRRC
jgi:RNA polymerase sigma-70 factor (ECF subfamily)